MGRGPFGAMKGLMDLRSRSHLEGTNLTSRVWLSTEQPKDTAAAPLPLGVEEGPRYTLGPRTVSLLGIRHSPTAFRAKKKKVTS